MWGMEGRGSLTIHKVFPPSLKIQLEICPSLWLPCMTVTAKEKYNLNLAQCTHSEIIIPVYTTIIIAGNLILCTQTLYCILSSRVMTIWQTVLNNYLSKIKLKVLSYTYYVFMIIITVIIVPINGEVVLIGVNGQDNEGIVEIYSPVKTYRWSPLCTSEWDDIDAQVVCRQLGFKGGSSKYYR